MYKDNTEFKKRINKYLYCWTVKVKYMGFWEEVYSSESYTESHDVLKDYRKNSPAYPATLVYQRVLNSEYKGK